MEYMFNKCNSLISLPDISKWETKNVISMVSIFEECSSLVSLPDITRWDTQKVIFNHLLLDDCYHLLNSSQFKKKYLKIKII